MAYFFIADTHFGSEEVLYRENRPFKNMKSFRKACIKWWNKVVRPDDIIYHLGDFTNYNHVVKKNWEMGLQTVKYIKCKVVLIIGNNEERIIKEHFDDNFEAFSDYCKKLGFYDVCYDRVISFADKSFYLNHYPCCHKDEYINLFGHTHRGSGLWKPYGLNVGCDLNFFRLFTEADILRLLEDKEKYWDHDINMIE